MIKGKEKACVRLAFLCTLLAPVLALSPDSASWYPAQAQNGYRQAQDTFSSPLGVTLFPYGKTVTPPAGCTYHNGTIDGYTPIPYSVALATSTEYVARVRSLGRSVLGKTTSDNCGPCNNTCPCANGTSWSFFPYNGIEVDAAAILLNIMGDAYTNSSLNFDILLQPSPDAGFVYSWVNMSSLAGNNNATTPVFSYDNVMAPCCVPLGQNDSFVRQAILKDNSPPWDPADQSMPATWRPVGATPTGSFMGFCNVATSVASFTWYGKVYNVSMANGGGGAQVLVMNATSPAANKAGPTISEQGQGFPAFTAPGGEPAVQPQNILFQVNEGYSKAAPDPANPGPDVKQFKAAVFNGGCSNSIDLNTVTSVPAYPITSNASLFSDPSNSLEATSWYLPAIPPSSGGSRWFPAVIMQNQTIGGPIAGMNQWALGRAFVDNNTQTWKGVFPYGAQEWNATRLAAPAKFYVFGQNSTWVDNQGFLYNDHYTFTYGSAAPTDNLPKHSFFMQLDGNVPCCIDSSVPKANSSDQTGIGKVLGMCNPSTKQASITWLGAVYSQNISQAQLLTMNVKLRPDPHRTAKIIGGVVGAVGGLLLLLLLVLLALWSKKTYAARSRKRLIQDQVYNLVMGDCSGTTGFDDVETDVELQGAVDIDRFYNLLPFVNRMPRNKFYANLSSKVAGRCLDTMRADNKIASRAADKEAADLHTTLRGYTSQALAYSIMKHETCWANTDRAIVEQWQSGSAGRGRLVHDVMDTLHSQELTDFLEGMDAGVEDSAPMRSRRCLVTFSRLFFFTVPSYRVSSKEANPLPENNFYSGKVAGKESGGFSSYKSMVFESSDATTSADTGTTKPLRSSRGAGLTGALHLLNMDDYEIKPTEIEIMTNADGTPAILGQGGFGMVCKARYNGVQLVAVKQLLEGGDEKAKIDFLREVAIMKKLRAENIVRFLGVCTKDGKTMLVTEFMGGGDLYKRLSETEPGGELAWHHLGRRIAVDIARGLAFLHGQNIVHLDLKSPNILLARDNTAKITDVGLARLTTADPVTHMSDMRGTLAWTAPEILRQAKGSFTTKADIYSFGVVLWEIVTGLSPHWGTNWYRSPRVPEECPASVAELIETCMLEDPAKRPTSKEIYRILLADDTLSMHA